MDHFDLTAVSYRHEARIELERPGESFRPGDAIQGTLHVLAGEGPPPRSLAVELQLAAHGEVSSVGVAATAPLPVGSWQRGQRYSYPFSLTVPPLPPPFAGQLFRTHARIAAVLDMPEHPGHPLLPAARAFPAAMLPVAVLGEGPLVVRPVRAARTIRLGWGAMRVGLILVGIGFLLAALAAAVTALELSIALAIAQGLLGIMFLVVGAVIVGGRFGNWRAERRIGTPEVSIEPRSLPDGLALSVSAKVAPQAPIERMKLRVKAWECMTTPALNEDGTQQSWGSERDAAFTEFELSPRQPGHWTLELSTEAFGAWPLPLPLFGTRIYWSCELVMEIAGGRQWKTWAMLEAFRGQKWEPLTTFSFQ